MSQLKINIPENFNKSTNIPFTSGNPFANLFDGIFTSPHAQINNSNSAVTLVFTRKKPHPIVINEVVLHLTTNRPEDVTVSLFDVNGGLLEFKNDTSLVEGANRFKFSNPNTPIGTVSVSLAANQFQNGALVLMSELEFFGRNFIPEFEFNDSVLDTKAWNSTRYDGRQLSATTINEFNEGDTSYGGTPVLQNYSRNIYLGSRIIGMESGSVEDTSLLNFSGFSYITAHEFITVNDDLSITKTTVRGDIGKNTKQKKGFYRSWYHDFPIGSTIEIKLMDKQLQQSIKPNYEVFNNSGQLQKLLLVRQHSSDSGSGYAATYRTSTNTFDYATGSGADLGAAYSIFNKELLIDEFFTGSLIATPPPFVPGGVLAPSIPGGD